MQGSGLFKRRNMALMMSALVLPGTGQFYNRQYLKGLIILVGFTLPALYFLTYVLIWLWQFYSSLIGFLPMENLPQLSVPTVVSSLVVAVIFYVWGAIDAYRTGKRLEEAPREAQESGS